MFSKKHAIVFIDLSGLSNLLLLKQPSVLVFLLSRNREISLSFLLLAGCRMFVLYNFKINQNYCFTAGIAGFWTKLWQLKKAIFCMAKSLEEIGLCSPSWISKAIQVYAASFGVIFNLVTAPHPLLRLGKCYWLILVIGLLTNNISRVTKTGFVAYGFK